MQNAKYVDSVTTVSALMLMIQKLCEHIGFQKFINSQVRWEPSQWKTSPGLLAEALIMNTLLGRDALYKVEEFFEKIDTETLFGEGISRDNFKDDAFATLLDRIHEADPKKLFSLFVFNALKYEDIFFESIHADTTSISLTGEYKDQQESAISLKRGRTKDHRPDLKQVMLGLIATKDGLPIFAEPLDGNKADSTWNKEVLSQIDDILYGAEKLLAEELKPVVQSNYARRITYHSRSQDVGTRLDEVLRLIEQTLLLAQEHGLDVLKEINL